MAVNTGWVSVEDHDTSAFAVATLRRWLTSVGQIAALATETGLAITVCHLPPGISKWNKIEAQPSPDDPALVQYRVDRRRKGPALADGQSQPAPAVWYGTAAVSGAPAARRPSATSPREWEQWPAATRKR